MNDDTETVGAGEYTVREGDCLTSIAQEKGVLPDTIWEDPQNASLTQARKDPNCLLVGDRLHIPPRKLRKEHGQTEKRHAFKVKTRKVVVRLRIMVNGQPLDDALKFRVSASPIGLPSPVEYTAKQLASGFEVPLSTREIEVAMRGSTDAPSVPPVRFVVSVGSLQDADTREGAERRLANLGYQFETALSSFGIAPDTRNSYAVRQYCTAHRVTPTSNLDASLRSKIAAAHDRKPTGA